MYTQRFLKTHIYWLPCHEDIHCAVKVKVHRCECEHTCRVGVDLVFKTSQEIVYGDPTEHTYVWWSKEGKQKYRTGRYIHLQIKHQRTYICARSIGKKISSIVHCRLSTVFSTLIGLALFPGSLPLRFRESLGMWLMVVKPMSLNLAC